MQPPKNISFFEGEMPFHKSLRAMSLQNRLSQGFLSRGFCSVFHRPASRNTSLDTTLPAGWAKSAANATLTMPRSL